MLANKLSAVLIVLYMGSLQGPQQLDPGNIVRSMAIEVGKQTGERRMELGHQERKRAARRRRRLKDKGQWSRRLIPRHKDFGTLGWV